MGHTITTYLLAKKPLTGIYRKSLSWVLPFNRTVYWLIEHATLSLSLSERCLTSFLQHWSPNSPDLNTDDYSGHPFMTSTRRGSGSGGRGGGGPAPCRRPHRKLKLESTDVVLSSSHAKKLASFLPEFRLWTEKSGNFSAI